MARQFQRRLQPFATNINSDPAGTGISSFANSLNAAIIRNQQNEQNQNKQKSTLDRALELLAAKNQANAPLNDARIENLKAGTAQKKASANKSNDAEKLKGYKLVLDQARNDLNAHAQFMKSKQLSGLPLNPDEESAAQKEWETSPDTKPIHDRLSNATKLIPEIIKNAPGVAQLYKDVIGPQATSQNTSSGGGMGDLSNISVLAGGNNAPITQ